MKSNTLLLKALALLGSIILAALVAGAEHYGRPISFSIFYLLAIYVCVHYVGKWPGIIFAIACGATWLYLEIEYNPIYFQRDRITEPVDPIIGYWNGIALTSMFVVFALLVASLESSLVREQRINRNLETLMTLSPSDPRGWLAPSGPSAEEPVPAPQQAPQQT